MERFPPPSGQEPPMTHASVSPLCQRLIDDMTIRHFASRTQQAYIRAIRRFSAFLGASPDQAGFEDVRRYQLFLSETGASPPTINHAVTALRFLFQVTLHRPEVMHQVPFVPEPRKLPVVLSPDEVARLLEAAPNLKSKAALSVAYGAGLRASEVVTLKVSDIDSTRMVIRVEQGKGRKDRYVMLSPQLLDLLRAWWRAARPQGWLFPGQNRVNPLTPRQLNRACHAAARLAEIDKPVSLHTLRHPPARAECRHPRHPGAARPYQARHHRPLHPRGHPAHPHRDEPARSSASRGSARLRPGPCPTGLSRWRRSSAPTEPPGVRPMRVTSASASSR